MLFEIDDPVIRSYDFFKNIDTLYDLLINLLNENKTILESLTMQLELTKIIFSLKSIISKKLKILQTKAEKKRKKFLLHQIVL